jgi:hypothetical protein
MVTRKLVRSRLEQILHAVSARDRSGAGDMPVDVDWVHFRVAPVWPSARGMTHELVSAAANHGNVISS